MIIQAEGRSCASSLAGGKTTKIVSATGTAYVRKGKLWATIRIVKRVVRYVKTFVKRCAEPLFLIKLNTKSGIPNNLAPPTV